MENDKASYSAKSSEYKIGNTTYVVKSYFNSNAKNKVISSIKRLLLKELKENLTTE